MKKVLVILPWALSVVTLGGGSAAVYFLVAKPAQKALAAEKEDKEHALEEAAKEKAHIEEAVQALEKQVEEFKEKAKREQANAHQLQLALEEIELALADPLRREVATVELEGSVLVITLESHLLYTTGSFELHDKGKELIRKASQALLRHPNAKLAIFGHIDNQPMPANLRGVFTSNWERAFGEAASVVHFLEDEVHVPPAFLSGGSFSQFQPKESNKTAVGRRRNHRTELRVSWETKEAESAPSHNL